MHISFVSTRSIRGQCLQTGTQNLKPLCNGPPDINIRVRLSGRFRVSPAVQPSRTNCVTSSKAQGGRPGQRGHHTMRQTLCKQAQATTAQGPKLLRHGHGIATSAPYLQNEAHKSKRAHDQLAGTRCQATPSNSVVTHTYTEPSALDDTNCTTSHRTTSEVLQRIPRRSSRSPRSRGSRMRASRTAVLEPTTSSASSRTCTGFTFDSLAEHFSSPPTVDEDMLTGVAFEFLSAVRSGQPAVEQALSDFATGAVDYSGVAHHSRSVLAAQLHDPQVIGNMHAAGVSIEPGYMSPTDAADVEPVAVAANADSDSDRIARALSSLASLSRALLEEGIGFTQAELLGMQEPCPVPCIDGAGHVHPAACLKRLASLSSALRSSAARKDHLQQGMPRYAMAQSWPKD